MKRMDRNIGDVTGLGRVVEFVLVKCERESGMALASAGRTVDAFYLARGGGAEE